MSLSQEIISNTLEYMKNILPSQDIICSSEIPVDYAHDELVGVASMPDILVRPTNTEQIAMIVKYANEHKIPVVCRGSGTGLVGAAVALEGGIMIETVNMNKIIELDKENLTVTVQPGVLLMDLAEFVESNNLLYPPDPGEKSATIGGNIATNAGGMRAVKYGVTRDYVRAMTVVLPSGEVVKLGGKVVKNSTGYSLQNLIVGSEGTLGIITEATLKLIPLPEVSVSLLVPFNSIEKAIEAVPQIIKSDLSLTAVEFFETGTILFAEKYLGKKFPNTSFPAYLLLTVDGKYQDFVDKEIMKASELCVELGALDVYFVDTDERKDSVWKPRGAFLEAIKASTDMIDECDVVVPRNKVADFIKYSHQVASQLDVRIPSFGHAGDGNLHVYVCRDGLPEDIWEKKIDESFDLLYKKASELSGLVSGEHGVGFAKKRYMRDILGDTQVEIMRKIKDVFDPEHILNPGKLF